MLAKLLDALKKGQRDYALNALTQVGDKKSEFDFGHKVGVIEGYERSINALLNILEEEKNGRDFD